jgi:small-conductance mechanosensitive channel
VGALFVDLAVIIVSAMAGYGVAVLATGQRGDLGTFELAFLNAFLAVEVARALIRTVFSARFEHLRLLPISDNHARYWNNWLERVSWLMGYSVLLLVPVLAALMSPELGRLIGLVIVLMVYIYGVRVIWTHRHTVANGVLTRAAAAPTKVGGTLLRVLAKLWHVLAIAYFTVLLVVSQVDPQDALAFLTFASLQTLLAVAAGVLLSAVLSILLTRRIQLPDDLRTRLPMLEARINAYVPAALKWVRLLIFVVVALVVLDAWQVFSVAEWLRSETGSLMVATLVRVSIVVAFAALIWTVVASIIEHRLSLEDGDQGGAPSARERTLLALFRNATLILIVTMTALIVLSQIGIDIGPLIAGAGVVGLAIGFGAQKLVQDVINGIFIQLENGMNQNDVVEVGGVFGTVEKITIRSVGIRTLDGGYHMIPFSSVDKVSNHMRDFSYHLGEYTVGYRESVDDVIYHLERAYEELMTDPVLAPEVLEDMVVAGVTSLNERGFTVRIMIKTKPGMQWAVQRGYNRLVKKHFNAAGIELPYPHTVVYFGQDKNGDAPPMRMRRAPQHDAAAPVMPAGHTPRPLTPADHSNAADVLGNELATVVDEEGNVSSKPGTQAERPANRDEASDSQKNEDSGKGRHS